MAWDVDVVSILQSAGVGTDNVSLFRGTNANIPSGDGPYTVIVVTAGSGYDRTHNSAPQPAYEYPGGQLSVHCKNSAVGLATVLSAKVALQAVRDTVIGSTYIREITCGNPSDGGKDDNKRALWRLNLIACRRPEGVN